MVDFDEIAALHGKNHGVLSVKGTFAVKNRADLGKAYTPGVAELAKVIEANPKEKGTYTMSGKLIPVITDGSAVLGLGNIGPGAGLPIVEGKALLYKSFADVDAIPMALEQTAPDELVATIKNMAPSFAGIHLEDIAAPKVFEIERRLSEELSIPVYHDDQTGTAIVVLAALINAAQVVGKELTELRVVVNGMGAAGVATSRLLSAAGIHQQTLVDLPGVVRVGDDRFNSFQQERAQAVNQAPGQSLDEVIANQDVFIGLSDAHVLSQEQVARMATDSIIFALANPVPEILPEEAQAAGAAVTATGSSQYENQVNNVLVFPGLFKGLLAAGIQHVDFDLQIAVAKALAGLVPAGKADRIVPGVFDEGVVQTVTQAVIDYGQQEG
ncbi:NAD-dependent malic enzyme [Leuconostocaceae bacterium ESL0958]|nr:NAD-dependent malic enzyme [Leuconostocaceae bacterium ESL0958]